MSNLSELLTGYKNLFARYYDFASNDASQSSKQSTDELTNGMDKLHASLAELLSSPQLDKSAISVLQTFSKGVEHVLQALTSDSRRLCLLTKGMGNDKIDEKKLSIASSESPDADGYIRNLVNFSTFTMETLVPLLGALPSDDVDVWICMFRIAAKLLFVTELPKEITTSKAQETVTITANQAIDKFLASDVTGIYCFENLLSNYHHTKQNSVSIRQDIVTGCEVLMLASFLQRNMRRLVQMCAFNDQVRDQSVALVFDGMFHVYKPLDDFSHRFLQFTLQNLGNVFPPHQIIPYYLDTTLALYPHELQKAEVQKVCGFLFGNVFYSFNYSDEQQMRQRLGVWMFRQCCNKVIMLDSDDLELASMVFELLKMSPLDLLELNAKEVEVSLFRQLETTEKDATPFAKELVEAVLGPCQSEKRTWLVSFATLLHERYASSPDAGSTEITARL